MSGALRVGIMGAGRMAQGFDAPGDGPVLSLAHAVTRTPGLALGGFYDRQPARAAAAEIRWGCPATPRKRTAWLAAGWDIVAIATPDAQHGADLRDALAHRPRAVLVEKPLAVDSREAEALLDAARQNDIALMVDFPRRVHSASDAVAKHIADGSLGAPVAASFVFSGEPAHSAIHMLDLLYAWWGSWSVAAAARCTASTLVELRREGMAMTGCFVSLPADDHYVWEMTVHCEKGRVQLADSPEWLELSLTRPHPLYPEFDVLYPVLRADMEGEPLLERTMASLREIATDREAAQRQFAHEIAAQQFSGAVLRALEEGRRRVENPPQLLLRD